MTLTERFLKYVSFCTTSDEETNMTPSTPGQMEFAKYLAEELKQIGMTEVTLDENGYVRATLPANTEGKPTIGFIAHMDTAPDASGKNVKARIVENYDGQDILLNAEKNIVFEVAKYPEILDYKGHDSIVTVGTTLLGADDKAGLAEIVTACEYLIQHPEIQHGKIRVGFTPDEEIGQGADHFDVEKFGCDFAYTMDGGAVGELEYENFNAAGAKAVFRGLNIHPGSAKGKMINSQYIAMEYQSLLPAAQKPEYTDGYEGFIHLTDMEGEVEQSTLRWIIRDHNMEKFQEKKAVLEAAAEFINRKYGEGTVELTIRDSYFNMREKIEPVIHIIDAARTAMEAVGMKPFEEAIRGGTDGARLSYMGLPCPNLFTGGENFHGRFEYIPIEDMEQCVELLVQILTHVE